MGVLGSMILSERATEEAIGLLCPTDFARPCHRYIFESMSRVFAKQGAIDFLLLKTDLVTCGRLADVGGENYLIQVAQFVPSPANCKRYASNVLDKSQLRRLSQIADEAKMEGAVFSDIQPRIEALLESTKPLDIPVAGAVGDFVQSSRSTRGVPTGFLFFDDNLSAGGLPRKQMTVVKAGTKQGKTALMCQMALDMAKSKYNVLYVTLADLSSEELAARFMRRLCGFDERPTQEPGPAAWDDAQAILSGLTNLRVYDSKGNRDLKTIEAIAQYIANLPDKPDAVFVDYFQKMKTRRQFRSTLESYEYISDQLKSLFERTGIAGVVGSQATQDESGATYTKGGRCLEEDAGLVISPRRVDKKEKGKLGEAYKGVAQLFTLGIDYNRFGQSDASVLAEFVGNRVMFVEL